jgi:hypothetical protein
MDNYKKVLLAFLMLLINASAFTQTNTAGTAEKTDVMVSEGKIYVVLAIVLTILAGLIMYVFRLDKKITKLERGEHL